MQKSQGEAAAHSSEQGDEKGIEGALGRMQYTWNSHAGMIENTAPTWDKSQHFLIITNVHLPLSLLFQH